jgi:hypothetical protein
MVKDNVPARPKPNAFYSRLAPLPLPPCLNGITPGSNELKMTRPILPYGVSMPERHYPRFERPTIESDHKIVRSFNA